MTAFRNALRAIVGTAHRDYRMLRTRRAKRSDDEPEIDETPPEVEDETPSAPSTTPASGTPTDTA